MEPLDFVAAEFAEQVERFLVLDPLGDDIAPEFMCHSKDRFDHDAIGGTADDATNEALIDFHFVRRDAPDIFERRKAGSEVVDREPESTVA